MLPDATGRYTHFKPCWAAAASMSAMAGWPGSSRSGRLATRVLNPSRAISATSSTAICGATEMLSSIFLISTGVLRKCCLRTLKAPRNPSGRVAGGEVSVGGCPETLKQLKQTHASHHRRHKYCPFDFASAQGNQPRPRAEAGNPPANTEHHTANNHTFVDSAIGGQSHVEAKKGQRTFSGNGKSHQPNDDGATHDKRKGGVPQAGDVEKAQYFLRVGHAGDNQAHTENQAGKKRGEGIFHGIRLRSGGELQTR